MFTQCFTRSIFSGAPERLVDEFLVGDVEGEAGGGVSGKPEPLAPGGLDDFGGHETLVLEGGDIREVKNTLNAMSRENFHRGI